MPTVTLNGKKHEIDTEKTIAMLLAEINVPTTGTAIAVNDEIISRTIHESHLIKDGDRIEIIRAIGGG